MHKSNIVGFQILPGPVDSRELAVAGILERDIIPLIILLISEMYFLCVATTIVALKGFSDIFSSKEI